MPSRPRWLHWLAWLGSIVSFVVLVTFWGGPDWDARIVQQVDLWVSVLFALEFVTRSGFRQDKWRYAKWRWFDFLAMLPVVFLLGSVALYEWFLWVVLVARLSRMVDRTLGDGFAKRRFFAFTEAIEEEVSDRVLLKIMARVESELASARFGETAAKAISANKEAILSRIYAEQLPEANTLSKVANFTGLQGAIEKMESRVFEAIIQVIGSAETDALIRDIVAQSMTRARLEIGEKSWKSRIGLQPTAGTSPP